MGYPKHTLVERNLNVNELRDCQEYYSRMYLQDDSEGTSILFIDLVDGNYWEMKVQFKRELVRDAG